MDTEHSSSHQQERQPWEFHLGAVVYALPVLYFLPYEALLPLLIWLIFRKRNFVAYHARVATIFWLTVQLILFTLSLFVAWESFLNLVWFVAVLWGIIASLAVWTELGNVFPPILLKAVAFWEKVEPSVFRWLQDNLKSSWEDTKKELSELKKSADTKMNSASNTEEKGIHSERIIPEPVGIPIKNQKTKKSTSFVNSRFPVLSILSLIFRGIGGLMILSAIYFIMVGLIGEEYQAWGQNPVRQLDMDAIASGVALIISGVFSLVAGELIGVTFAIELSTRRLYELEKETAHNSNH